MVLTREGRFIDTNNFTGNAFSEKMQLLENTPNLRIEAKTWHETQKRDTDKCTISIFSKLEHKKTHRGGCDGIIYKPIDITVRYILKEAVMPTAEVFAQQKHKVP